MCWQLDNGGAEHWTSAAYRGGHSMVCQSRKEVSCWPRQCTGSVSATKPGEASPGAGRRSPWSVGSSPGLGVIASDRYGVQAV